MHPNDVKDLVTAFSLLIFFIIGTMVYQSLYEEHEIFEEIEIDDDVDLFLLNYIKTELGDGKTIRDLILEAEGNEEVFENLEEESESILDFIRTRRHNVRIVYPDEEKTVGDDDFEEFSEIKLINENGEVILVKMGAEFVEEWL